MTPIKIQLLFREAEYYKLFGNIKMSTEKFIAVKKMCEIWTGDDNNESIRYAALFNLGLIYLESGNIK